ncbi:50S ribosomal protein L33 [Weissella viridescens]|uniref:Large ribosomal subunit protein bL33 n=1 Tax=Weissella viridescens TaxID=1629 RepID=A0A380NY99_WEIVI|nr:50S ribosomal protein L33 [Weissella viridescens]
MAQKKVALACNECGSRNYTIAKKPDRSTRLEVKSIASIAKTYHSSRNHVKQCKGE